MAGKKRFHPRAQPPCKFTGTKGSVLIRKLFDSLRIGSVHQHGHLLFVLFILSLEHHSGYRDVM